jgi:hypothetical protein
VGCGGGSRETPEGLEGKRGIQETPAGPERKDTKRTGGNNGGIGARRKARRAHRRCALSQFASCSYRA